MAQKITQTQINEMIELYNQLKTYSAVAKQMGISPSTVSRYIKASKLTTTPNIKNKNIAAKPIDEISTTSIISFSILTDEEKKSMDEWLKEFKR